MSGYQVIGDDGKPVDIKTGDVITTNGGILGLGHAGIIEERNGVLVVIEVMAAADGSVHVQERNIDDFLKDYAAQDRDVFISRPKKPAETKDADWERTLKKVVQNVKDKVCTRYPTWLYVINTIWNIPAVWYCSQIVVDAFLREGIEIEITLPMWEASDDKDTRDFMFMLRGEAVRRFGEKQADRFLRGFHLPQPFAYPGVDQGSRANEKRRSERSTCCKEVQYPASRKGGGAACDSFDQMVDEHLFEKRLERIGALVDMAIHRAAETLEV